MKKTNTKTVRKPPVKKKPPTLTEEQKQQYREACQRLLPPFVDGTEKQGKYAYVLRNEYVTARYGSVNKYVLKGELDLIIDHRRDVQFWFRNKERLSKMKNYTLNCINAIEIKERQCELFIPKYFTDIAPKIVAMYPQVILGFVSLIHQWYKATGGEIPLTKEEANVYSENNFVYWVENVNRCLNEHIEISVNVKKRKKAITSVDGYKVNSLCNHYTVVAKDNFNDEEGSWVIIKGRLNTFANCLYYLHPETRKFIRMVE